MMSEFISTTVWRAFAMTLTFLLTAGVPPAIAQRAPSPPRKLDVPYEPTPHRVVLAMLRLGEVKQTDYLIDLGCGDGRIPVTAAETYGVRALCVDLDPARIKEATANANRAGVADKVEVLEQDLFKTDLSKADVLTLYLWPEVNLKLRPRLLELRPGTRIVSHEHHMGDWRPDATKRVGSNVVYFWRVPARIAGNWRLSAEDQDVVVTLDQKYQDLTGSSKGPRGMTPVRDGRITGRDVSFLLALPTGGRRRFKGTLTEDGRLQGSGWKAVRIS